MDSEVIRLVTYNVEQSARDAEVTADVIAQAGADLVLLQETTPVWEQVLRARFGSVYPHLVFHHHHRGSGGLAVLSRTPIVDDLLLPAVVWFPAQRVVVATAIGELEILHVHLRPSVDQGDWVRGWFTTPPIRRREIAAFWPHLRRDRPVVVAGDFNENALTGLALAFLAEQGLTRVPTGPTWSFHGRHAGRDVDLEIDLDHVVIDRGLVARSAAVLPGGASDHRAVVIELEAAASW